MKQVDMIRLDLPAAHTYLNVLGACVTEMVARIADVPERDVTAYNLQLAVHEVCTNIVDHAYSSRGDGRIAICLSLLPEPRRLQVELHDTGTSFDPAAVAEPDLENAQVHGYGLFLINQLMDEVLYRAAPDGNHWTLVKAL